MEKNTYCLSEHYDFPGIKAFVYWLCSNWAQQKYLVCCCPSICLQFYLSVNGPNVYSFAELPLNKTLRYINGLQDLRKPPETSQMFWSTWTTLIFLAVVSKFCK